jgi:hypothetical protein
MASGQAVVTLGGKDIYLGPHDTEASKVEYDRLIAEWLVHGRSISPDPEQAIPRTVLEIIAAYVQHAQRYHVKDGAPTPEVGHVRIAMRPVRRLYGRTPAMACGPIALKVVRQAVNDAREKLGVSERRAQPFG